MHRKEDEHAELQETDKALKKRNKVLEDKVVDMEMRWRLNNLRLVNLPEGAERPDPCWLPELLNLVPLRRPIVMERAHRVGLRRYNERPRTLIVRFLNYKQKIEVIKVAEAKRDTLYKKQQVRF